MAFFVRAARVSFAPITCVIDNPVDGTSTVVGVTLVISGTISRPGTVTVTKTIGASTVTLGAATVVGLSWSYSYALQDEDEGEVSFGATARATIGGPASHTAVSVTVVSDFPATLASLALWLNGAQPAYSDAGVTPATVPYGRVGQIAQPAPLSGNWTSSGSARPWREANGIDVHFNNPNGLTQPASAPIPNNNCTIGIAAEHRHGQNQDSLFMFRNGPNNNSFGIAIVGELFFVWFGGSGAGPVNLAPALPHGSSKVALVVTCTPSQVLVEGNLNGTPFTATLGAPQSGNLGTLTLGNGAGPGVSVGHCAISQFTANSQALDSTQRAGLMAFLLANMAGGPPTSAPLIVMNGDSISAAWQPVTQTSLDGNATPPRWINTGVSGATMGPSALQITTWYATAVAPHYSSARAKNIIIAEGISTNDLQSVSPGTEAARAASVLANYYAYCDMLKAAGWRVLLCTLLPKVSSAEFETVRQIINTNLRANYLAHGHRLVDIGGAAGMSLPSDASGPNFGDGLHPNSNGYVIMNGVLLPELTAELAA